MRSVAFFSILSVLVLVATCPAIARQAKGKKAAKAQPTAEPKPPQDEGGSALASCKKHVESMLKESAETRFAGDQEIKVQRGDGGNYDIAGWVTWKSVSGDIRRADFNCHASRYGGGLWTTKTSLSFDR